MIVRTSYDVNEFDFSIIIPATQSSYWGNTRNAEDIVNSFKHSFCVGLFHSDGSQTGWARATSDTVFHAYIYDLQVVPEFQGNNLGRRLTTDLMNHPSLVKVGGWMLSTRSHHHLYYPLGFVDADQGRYMTLKKPS